MEAILTLGTQPTLAARASELKKALDRLRNRYWQAHARLELGPPRDPMIERERAVAHRQLAVLVPMHRAMVALAQQPRAGATKAKAVYLEHFSKAVSLVDRMVNWADGTEEEFGELLDLRVPVDVSKLYEDGAEVQPMRERMENLRAAKQAAQKELSGLVTKLIMSFTSEQREMFARYQKLTNGRDLHISGAMLKVLAHG